MSKRSVVYAARSVATGREDLMTSADPGLFGNSAGAKKFLRLAARGSKPCA
jgi:hypothetical protein